RVASSIVTRLPAGPAYSANNRTIAICPSFRAALNLVCGSRDGRLVWSDGAQAYTRHSVLESLLCAATCERPDAARMVLADTSWQVGRASAELGSSASSTAVSPTSLRSNLMRRRDMDRRPPGSGLRTARGSAARKLSGMSCGVYISEHVAEYATVSRD